MKKAKLRKLKKEYEKDKMAGEIRISKVETKPKKTIRKKNK